MVAWYIVKQLLIFLVVFGICYAIAKFAGSNTPTLLALMICAIYKLSERIYEQENLVKRYIDEVWEIKNNINGIYDLESDLNNKVENLEYKISDLDENKATYDYTLNEILTLQKVIGKEMQKTDARIAKIVQHLKKQ